MENTKNFSEEIIQTLEEDLNLLLQKRKEACDKNNIRSAIEYTRLIKDTLYLIHDEKKLLKYK